MACESCIAGKLAWRSWRIGAGSGNIITASASVYGLKCCNQYQAKCKHRSMKSAIWLCVKAKTASISSSARVSTASRKHGEGVGGGVCGSAWRHEIISVSSYEA